jgi:type IV pilus assembly protein PilE
MKIRRGFTLLEIMIVVAIIGILASIAYPSYMRQIIQSQRTDARTAIFNIAQQQEEFFVQNMQYAPDLQTLYGGAAAIASVPSPEQEYNVTIQAGCGNPCMTYTITATPAAGSTQARDEQCASMSVNNLGLKTALDDGGAASTVCW